MFQKNETSCSALKKYLQELSRKDLLDGIASQIKKNDVEERMPLCQYVKPRIKNSECWTLHGSELSGKSQERNKLTLSVKSEEIQRKISFTILAHLQYPNNHI